MRGSGYYRIEQSMEKVGQGERCEALSGNERPLHGDEVDVGRAVATFKSDAGAQLPLLGWLCHLGLASEKEFGIEVARTGIRVSGIVEDRGGI